MGARYEITSGKYFWDQMKRINDLIAEGYYPVSLDKVDNGEKYTLYLYDDLALNDDVARTFVITMAENVLFPLQYRYLGPGVALGMSLQKKDHSEWVQIYEYPREPVVTCGDLFMALLEGVFNLFKNAIIGVGAGINNFFDNL